MCLKESGKLITKSPKYWLLVFKLYASSIRKPLQAKIFRAAYLFCRHIDDVLDGDRKINHDPELYVQEILNAMNREENGPEIIELYRFAVKHLMNMAKNGEDPKALFFRVIKGGMQFDHQRSRQKRVLTRDELEKYYQDTFAPVMDLALMISGSDQRSSDLPESITTQGHIYTIRDLEQDLRSGIINIPLEELEKSEIDRNQAFGRRAAERDPHLSDWIRKEVTVQQGDLKQWEKRLKDNGAREVCLPLIWQMKMFCRLHQLGLH